MFGPESTTWSFGDSSHVVENQRDLILSGTNSARADIWFFGRQEYKLSLHFWLTNSNAAAAKSGHNRQNRCL
jgi:hypothetical protein